MLGRSAEPVLSLAAHRDKLADVGFPDAVEGRLRPRLLGEPPGVGGHNHPGRHHPGNLGLELALAQPVLYPDPVPLGDTQRGGRIGVDFHHRVGVCFPQPGNLAVLRMEIDRRPSARAQNQGVLFIQFRLADRGEMGLFIMGQRLQSPVFPQGGVKLDFPRGRLKAGFSVRPQLSFLKAVIGMAGVALGGERPSLSPEAPQRSSRRVLISRQRAGGYFPTGNRGRTSGPVQS